jgi:hypothetical protein
MSKVITDNKPVSRFERKFSILPRNIGFALAFLRQICRPDREYPKDRVTSLYFDSADLDEYIRSASGEFRKNKVRIRWYGTVRWRIGMTSVYLELKSREGFASSKQREKLTVHSENLLPIRLGRGIVDKTTLNNTLAKFGHFTETPLRPVIVISYQRYRFQEIQTGIRVSFDYDISASMIAPELRRHESRISLPGAVIEVKGPTLELPVTLRRMKFLDTDWSRFSKYGYSVDAFLSDPGSVTRFSPSGTIIDL